MEYTKEKIEMIALKIPASVYGKAHTLYIVPVEGMYGVWITREDAEKILYTYCLPMGPEEDVIREVLGIVPMYVDFWAPEFDDPGPIWP